MYFLDAIFRFSAVGMLLLIAITTYRDNRSWRGSPYLILACISVSGLYVGYTIDALRPPDLLHAFARIIDVPHLVFVWLFAQALYQNEFKLMTWHWLTGLVYTAPIFWIRLNGLEMLPLYPAWLLGYVSATSFLLAGHLSYVILKEWRDDLQHERRKSRLYFVALLVLVVGVAALAEPVLGRDSFISLRTFTILSIWPAVAAGAFWLLSANRKALLFGSRQGSPEALNEKDQALYAKLKVALEEKEVFRDPKLGIVGLASDLGVTQHRLRSLINESLGFRNFSTFLAGYRMEAVLRAFEDDARSHKSIQTIAYECGFNSMPPFNRAFRAQTGRTPSEYRDQHKAE